jgi:branched-chain amino acid transport system ATP-binding protein
MLLDLKNISAGYGDHEVLRGISLEVKEGEIVALIGPNGAGKSTVLKTIIGLIKKTGGQVLWEGGDISGLPTHSLLEEGIGFVPQGRLVFPSLTVRENLEMGGYLIDHRETLAANLEQALARFPVLKPRLAAKAGSLSGGEQQMLAIGRALMMSPKLLMLDEPSLGLSPRIVHEVYEKLMEIRSAGTALLVVEQNVRLVLSHAERGYLLAAGQVRFAGAAAELGDERRMHEAYLI